MSFVRDEKLKHLVEKLEKQLDAPYTTHMDDIIKTLGEAFIEMHKHILEQEDNG